MSAVQHCPRSGCTGVMSDGYALMQDVPTMGMPDFIGDTIDSAGQTVSYQCSGERRLCRKCGECGHSVGIVTEEQGMLEIAPESSVTPLNVCGRIDELSTRLKAAQRHWYEGRVGAALQMYDEAVAMMTLLKMDVDEWRTEQEKTDG